MTSASGVKRDRDGARPDNCCLHGALWTDAELAYLDAHKSDALADIARALGRSEDSVRNKMLRLGYIERKRVARGWTDAEDNYLYAHYGTMGAEAIGKRLKRTAVSVKHRAAVLGLRAYDEFISLKLLAQIFGCDPSVIHRWIAQYGMPASHSKRGAGDYFRIDEGAFWKWADAHRDIIPWHSYDGSLTNEPEWAAQEIASDRRVNHRAPVTRAVKHRAEALYTSGASISAIADAMGRTPDSIRHMLRNSASA